MILEHAILPVKPGLEAEFEAALVAALPILRRQPGCLRAEVSRCVEQRAAYLLLAEWESVEAHELDFRLSADYQEWSALLHHFYDPFPAVRHFAALEV